MLFDFFLFLLIGVLSGVMSGMLGVGGGIVVVPALVFVFLREHFPSQLIMHFAEGTSLAAMIVTTSMALQGHRSRNIIFWSLCKRFLPGVIVGIIGGAILADYFHSKTLKLIFCVAIFISGIGMLFSRSKIHSKEQKIPSLVTCFSVGSLLGTFSGLLGVGSGSLSVLILRYLSIRIRETVALSCAFVIVIGVIGALSFILIEMSNSNSLPAWSSGYVYWPAVLGINLGSVLFTTAGVQISHYLPPKILQKIFGIFLLLVSFNVLYLNWS